MKKVNFVVIALLMIYQLSSAQIITTIAGGGNTSLNNSIATDFQFSNGIRGLFKDTQNNLYIAASNGIYRLSSATNRITLIAGGNGVGFAGDGLQTPSAAVWVNFPSDMIIDQDGNLIFTDTLNDRIRKVNLTTKIITTIAGNGTAPNVPSPVEGIATDVRIMQPQGIFLYNSNVYFAATSSNSIKKYDPVTNMLTNFGNANFFGDSPDGLPASETNMYMPTNIFIDNNGNIFYCDSVNNKVKKIDGVTKIVKTVAGIGGAAGFSGDGGLATQAKLSGPNSVVVDSNGNLYISDTYNNRIRKVDANTGIITTIAGTGIAGFSGDGGSPLLAELNQPKDLWLDSNGEIYIADYGNNRVRKFQQTLSTNDLVKEQFSIHPNPVKGNEIFISNYENVKYYIFDMSGKLLLSGKINNGKVNVSILNKGIYLIKIGDISKRFIKE